MVFFHICEHVKIDYNFMKCLYFDLWMCLKDLTHTHSLSLSSGDPHCFLLRQLVEIALTSDDVYCPTHKGRVPLGQLVRFKELNEFGCIYVC